MGSFIWSFKPVAIEYTSSVCEVFVYLQEEGANPTLEKIE